MATTNLFGDPVFRDGAFTSNDATRPPLRAAEDDARDRPRRGARRRDVRLLGRTRGHGDERREGRAGSDEVVPRRDQLPLRVRAARRSTIYKFALEPKPNEPRGDIFLPTIGHMLAFIYTLDHPEMVGLNPEVAHDTMAGLDFTHGVAQALEAGKLFHIDLNAQKPGRFDQDLRFGSEDIKGAFFLVKLLEDSRVVRACGTSTATRIAPRTSRACGTSPPAACAPISSSRRRSARFKADAEIQGLLGELAARGATPGQRVRYSDAEARSNS